MDGVQPAFKYIGVWVKGDGLSKFRLRLRKKNDDGTFSPYVLNAGADSVTFELRSADGTGASFNRAFSIVDGPNGIVELTDPGASWTVPSGKKRERFDGYPKVSQSGGSGYAFPVYGDSGDCEPAESFRLTLRTAP